MNQLKNSNFHYVKNIYSDVHKGDMLLYVTFVIWVTREDDARHILPLGGLSKTLPVTFVMT